MKHNNKEERISNIKEIGRKFSRREISREEYFTALDDADLGLIGWIHKEFTRETFLN